MRRLLLAILAGVVTNGLLVWAVELLSTVVFPLPAGVDPRNSAQLADYLRSGAVPVGAMVVVIVAYAVGAFGGGYVATRVAHNRGLMPALVIGQLSLVFVIVNLVMLPHPLWMAVASVLVPVPLAWLGGRAAGARGGEHSGGKRGRG